MKLRNNVTKYGLADELEALVTWLEDELAWRNDATGNKVRQRLARLTERMVYWGIRERHNVTVEFPNHGGGIDVAPPSA